MPSVTVRIDPHVHSDDSYDGHEPIELILEHAAEIGLDAVVITDHDVIGESKRAADVAEEYGLIGIPGVEVSTAHGHLLAIGVERMPPRRKPYDETIAWIHEHGGVAIVPHPFQRSRHGVRQRHVPVPDLEIDADGDADVRTPAERFTTTGAGDARDPPDGRTNGAAPVDAASPADAATQADAASAADATTPADVVGRDVSVDAIEVFNAWLFTGYRNRRARRFAAKYDFPGVAASDAHSLEYVGRAFTELEIEGAESVADVTADDVLAAIRDGTTTVNGRRAPIRMAAKHYVWAAARKSGYYARASALRSALAAKWAAGEAVSTARVAVFQGAHRAARILSWMT